MSFSDFRRLHPEPRSWLGLLLQRCRDQSTSSTHRAPRPVPGHTHQRLAALQVRKQSLCQFRRQVAFNNQFCFERRVCLGMRDLYGLPLLPAGHLPAICHLFNNLLLRLAFIRCECLDIMPIHAVQMIGVASEVDVHTN